MNSRYFALIPAAGIGRRMEQSLPKQYLPILNKPLMYFALQSIVSMPWITQVYVVLAEEDRYWDEYDWTEFSSKLVVLRCGGEQRADSVLSGLQAMGTQMFAEDWVLVHDAARPCLTGEMLNTLRNAASDTNCGAILAMPVSDTLKRVNQEGEITATVARSNLWHAQTPQIFRYGLLRKALEASQRLAVTDEASAIENLGYHPLVVENSGFNLKVTHPHDLRLAEYLLKMQNRG